MALTYRYAGIDMVAGGILGVLGATMNESAGRNLTTSAGASLLGNLLSTHVFKQQEKFLSRETAVSTVLTTGASAVSYMITDALIHKHHKPEMKIEIQAAEDKPCTPCQNKLWAARMENAASEQERLR